MSKKQKRIFWPGLLIILAAAGALGLVVARTWAKPAGNRPAMLTQPNASPPPGKRPAVRNLSLQPEALKLSRNLGQRFMKSRREVSVLSGTLVSGTNRQPIRIQRQQNDRGERVEVAIGGRPTSLNWSNEEGAKSADRAASESERVLIERLTFDSVDQFVLAQLRGASYYTVARNVMPAEAGGADDYRGPVWDIIRVDEPETDALKQPLSKWRLYYLNSQTGLIDKVISEVNGERIETNFADWTDEGGEKFPTRITWTRLGQSIMELTLTNFAHHPQQQ
jgi:hypothetical protein